MKIVKFTQEVYSKDKKDGFRFCFVFHFLPTSRPKLSTLLNKVVAGFHEFACVQLMTMNAGKSPELFLTSLPSPPQNPGIASQT